ncbi:hypothetical protein AMATHDRAFT_156171 [Amanita thiersii Skay4041]|uniref:G-protein coupled receptors family 1 profile domain-containing protein n=1 Tax=Amanita thiersii Skay4041 TaxID=703135 RepID=A0A2A9NEI5_9AGAR|nr:hypothetical protein AMATHDRAFT_156171 [Amanita thiersii Skay4041]
MSPAALQPPPPGLNYISVVQPSLGILMVALTGTAVLFPLLVILFFFSTKSLRRKPIFVMNVISIILGLTLGISFTFIMYQAITNPSNLLTRFAYLFPAFSLTLIPIFVDSILLLRLLIVYPFHATPHHVFILIFFPLMCIKAARIVDVGLFIDLVISAMSKAIPNPVTNIQTGWTNQIAFLKAESFLQVIDNVITSCLFLYRLDIRKMLVQHPSENSFSRELPESYTTSTIRGLFWIAISNFIFPLLLGIVELVFMFHDPSFIHGIIVGIINAYVSIIGVLLATVWAASVRWTEEHHPSVRENNAVSTIHFTQGYSRNNSAISMADTIGSMVSPGMGDLLHEETMVLEAHNKSKAADLV